jgi:hypothetical protein
LCREAISNLSTIEVEKAFNFKYLKSKLLPRLYFYIVAGKIVAPLFNQEATLSVLLLISINLYVNPFIRIAFT